jgi:hypothetical protein
VTEVCLIPPSESAPESVEVRRGEDGWYWTYRHEGADLSLRSNDDFESLDAAVHSAGVAYPQLEPRVIEARAPSPDRNKGEVSRAAELVRLAAAGLGATAVVAWWRRRNRDD